MSGDNLLLRSNGQRQCRQCARDRARAAQRKKGIKPRAKPDSSFEAGPRQEGYYKSNSVHELHCEAAR